MIAFFRAQQNKTSPDLPFPSALILLVHHKRGRRLQCPLSVIAQLRGRNKAEMAWSSRVAMMMMMMMIQVCRSDSRDLLNLDESGDSLKQSPTCSGASRMEAAYYVGNARESGMSVARGLHRKGRHPQSPRLYLLTVRGEWIGTVGPSTMYYVRGIRISCMSPTPASSGQSPISP